jgi:hypothetical protein
MSGDGGWAELAQLDSAVLGASACGGWSDLELSDTAVICVAGSWGDVAALDEGLAAERGDVGQLGDVNIGEVPQPRAPRGRPPKPPEEPLGHDELVPALAPSYSSHAVDQMAVAYLLSRPSNDNSPPAVPELELAAVALGRRIPFVASPFLGHIGTCTELAMLSHDTETDDDIMTFADQFLNGTTFHSASDTALAMVSGLDRRQIPTCGQRLASAATLLDRCQQAVAEKSCSLIQDVVLLEYIDGCRFDETPLHMKVREELAQSTGHKGADAQIASQQIEPREPAIHGIAEQAGGPPGPLKVLQTESTYTMLLKITTAPGPRYMLVRGSSANWLQAGDRMTSDVMKELLSVSSPCSLGALQFEQKTRAVCTDRLAANFKAERAMVKERGDSWKLLHLECRMHTNATVHGRTFDKLDSDHISNMIHLALSLRAAGQMRTFRRFIKTWVTNHVVRSREHPQTFCPRA